MDTDAERGAPHRAPAAELTGPSGKLLRTAAMTRRLLAEVRAEQLDSSGVERLRAIDTQTIEELQTALPLELRNELHRLALPLTSHAGCSAAELRIAHAQLVGWLEGLLTTMCTPASDPQDASVTFAPSTQRGDTAQATPKHDESGDEPPSAPTPLGDHPVAEAQNAAILTARRTIMTAISQRIIEQRLTATEAAALVRLAGSRMTKLFYADGDYFTLDELVSFLAALGLRIEVLPEAARDVQPGG